MTKNFFTLLFGLVFTLTNGLGYSESVAAFPNEYKDGLLTFHFNHTPGKTVQAFASKLRQEIIDVNEFFEISNQEPVNLTFFDGLKSLHCAMGQPNAPDWVVGGAVSLEKGIYLVNPGQVKTLSSEEYEKVVVHEYVHILQMKRFGIQEMFGSHGTSRLWLSEGLAVCLAKQIDVIYAKASVGKIIKTINQDILEYLSVDPIEFGKRNGYLVASVLVRYITDKYGKDRLFRCYSASNRIEDALGVSTNDFLVGFHEYLKQPNNDFDRDNASRCGSNQR